MGRLRLMKAGVLNVKIHPHTAQKYVEVFQQAYKDGQIVKVRGLDFAMLGLMWFANESNPLDGIHGTIWRFVNIDPRQPWINLLNHAAIDPSKGKTVVIPDSLKPHLRKAEFVFNPLNHRLFFDSEALKSTSAQKLFDGVLNTSSIAGLFGKVDVIVEQSVETITKIIAMKEKSSISIRITRPNGDTTDVLKKRMIERLTAQNVRVFDEVLSGGRGGDIKPDAETIGLMRVACSEGRVVVKGKIGDSEKAVELSTESHPKIMQSAYDPEQIQSIDVLDEICGRFVAE